MRVVIIIVVLFFQSVVPVTANNNANLFEQANTYYSEGKYRQALSTYRQLDSMRVISPELYYNMGNTYYKLQNYPYAVYYYKKALKYRPGDKAIKQNLELARSKTVDKIDILPQSPFTVAWHSVILLTTAKNWTYIALFWLLTAFAALVFYRIKNTVSLKRLFFISGVVALMLSGLSVYLGIQNQHYFTHTQEAVIVAPTIDVYSEPGNKGVKLFTLHEGTEVVVEEEVDNFVKIKLPNEKSGWIAKSYIMIV